MIISAFPSEVFQCSIITLLRKKSRFWNKNFDLRPYRMNRHKTLFLLLPLILSFVISQEADSVSISVEESSVSLIPIEITVDLSGAEISSVVDQNTAQILARPWYKNFTISGFGGFDYLQSGSAGTRPNGGFLIKEATLFIEADIWNDQSFFLEIQTNRLGEDSTMFIRTGEIYIHFRNIFESLGKGGVGLKIGRIDIPFGEEYLWQDASDNPLISNSVFYPYGLDEGILVYGKISQLGWIFSIMDGTYLRSVEDHPSKALVGKIYSNLSSKFYVSTSVLVTGLTSKSAIEFADSHLEPVGLNHFSTAGVSPSDKISAILYETDVKYSFGTVERYGYLSFSFGRTWLEDLVKEYNRQWGWYSVEPLIKISSRFYFILRYSVIGTFNSEKGYHFDGKTMAGGIKAFGYDTRSLKRLSLGASWNPNPRLITKFEIGRDWFALIDSSLFDPRNNQRYFFGFEVVAIF